MPPKLKDGDWILPGGGLFFADGSPATIETVELPPEPGWAPPEVWLPDAGFSGEVFLPRAQWKRMMKGMRAAENRMRRLARTMKRRREKERRRRVKGDNTP